MGRVIVVLMFAVLLSAQGKKAVPFTPLSDAERLELLSLTHDAMGVYQAADKAIAAATTMQRRVKDKVDKLVAEHGAAGCVLDGGMQWQCGKGK